MAPTGRAARRMAESTGSGDATTMHMALGLFGDGDYEALIDELSADFINVDEVSMVDMHLAYEFLQGKSRSQSAFGRRCPPASFCRSRRCVPSAYFVWENTGYCFKSGLSSGRTAISP